MTAKTMEYIHFHIQLFQKFTIKPLKYNSISQAQDKSNQQTQINKAKHIKFNQKQNSLPASSKFCNPPIIFTNSLDPYQARQNVGPDLD